MMLGYLFWWELHDVRVPHAELRQRLDEVGFSVPLDPPTAYTVEQRAAREAQRLGRKGGQEVELAALRESYQGMHIAIDVTRLLVALVTQVVGAVGVRSDGRLIFAPPAARDDLLRLRTLVRSLPSSGLPPVFFMVAVQDEAQTRANLAEALGAGLLQDLAALERDLKRLRRAPINFPGTLSLRQAQVQTEAQRAAMHAELLGEAQRAAVEGALQALGEVLKALERRALE